MTATTEANWAYTSLGSWPMTGMGFFMKVLRYGWL